MADILFHDMILLTGKEQKEIRKFAELASVIGDCCPVPIIVLEDNQVWVGLDIPYRSSAERCIPHERASILDDTRYFGSFAMTDDLDYSAVFKCAVECGRIAWEHWQTLQRSAARAAAHEGAER